MKTYTVLSIDAWGNKTDGFEWNAWHKVGAVTVDIDADDATIMQAMIDAGFLKPRAMVEAYIDDDQYNLVICEKQSETPLYAIEYGNVDADTTPGY